MIKPIVKDVFFLGQKSDPATSQDLQTGQDLHDTLKANESRCVGMAANMIGVKKRIIIVNTGFMNLVMYNPVIVKKDTPYETEEGCLSLEGVRKTTRFDPDDENVGKELMSYEVKELAAVDKNFQGTLTDLQMQTYLILSDFRQRKNKKGQTYGWHIAAVETVCSETVHF